MFEVAEPRYIKADYPGLWKLFAGLEKTNIFGQRASSRKNEDGDLVS